ncbi:MAG: hypothetical protein IT536_11190 [Hyphomicrobiales bacterium]|nr:hypothetical protein [Hyphomicrobiales bacterium]
MRVLTKSELARMTRLELLALLRQAANALGTAPEHSPDRETALINLRKIQRALALSPLS